MKNFKLNNIVSIVIVLLVIGGIWYFVNVSPEKDSPKSSNGEESMVWQKAEYYNTPAGLPEFVFNYANGLRISQNEYQEPDTLTFSLIDIDKEKKVLSGEEKEFLLTATDIINLCYIGPNCFSNLPDVYKKYNILGNEPLTEIKKMQYGENVFTVYKDPTQGIFPHSIYVLRIGTDRILGIFHFGDSEPPSTIDLESIRLTEK